MSTQKYIKIGGQVPIVLKEIACTLKDNTATEATLQEIEDSLNSILTAIQSEQDYEAKLVVDDNGNGQTYLEVRRWNSDTQTWETPEYYLPGSNTPSTPILPLVYINPNTFLAQIVSNTTGLATETTLNAVDTKLSSVVVTPSLIRATGLGAIAAGAYSFSVANVGLLDGILLGVVIRPGDVINFDAGALNNTYGSVSYDGTGTELLITVNS
jgi:hypothetical protein